MSAAIKLEIFQNGQLMQEIPFPENFSKGIAASGASSADLWIGRDEACVIRLDDRAISRKHALLRSTEQGIEFEKKSKFGWVKVNGAESTRALLKEGDHLELGPFEIRVKKDSVPEAEIPPMMATLPNPLLMPEPETRAEAPLIELTAAPAEEAQPEIEIGSDFSIQEAPPEGVENVATSEVAGIDFNAEPQVEPDSFQSTKTGIEASHTSGDGATKVFTVPEKVKAVLEFGETAGNFYEINDDEIAIGRSQQCHVVLEDRKSSRKHVTIRRERMNYFLKDLGSSNGTLVNGTRMVENSEIELQSGDQVQIGETLFTFKLVQADYEQKKEKFIPVPQQEAGEPRFEMAFSQTPQPKIDVGNAFLAQPELHAPVFEPAPAQFEAPPEPKKTLIGRFLDRYRAMNTKQQIIWGAAILAAMYFLMFDDDTPVQKAHLISDQKKVVKKEEKRVGTGQSFEALTPEQKRYIEAQYQLAFELYKNREYDKCLLELNGIFNLVKDYKNAREIETFAREGKRKLEAQEDERKRKEMERQAQLKLQTLLEQAGLLMDKKRFREAEALFPEIELIQPENAAVNEWRKQIMAEGDRIEREREEQKRIAELRKVAWSDFQKARELVKKENYMEALDAFDELLERPGQEKKFVNEVKAESDRVEALVKTLKDPFLAQGKQLEQDGKLAEAYRAYEKAASIDPSDETAPEGMARIRGTLTSKAKYLYAEGVFAESYSDIDTAEKKYREVLEVVPKEDDYYSKAETRLKKITVLKRPASSESPQ